MGVVILVFTVPLLDRLKIDDVVGAIPVHLFAGIWGTIAVVFTNSDANLVNQLISIIIVGVFVFVVSFVVWFILKATMGLRPSAEDEDLGLESRPIPSSSSRSWAVGPSGPAAPLPAACSPRSSWPATEASHSQTARTAHPWQVAKDLCIKGQFCSKIRH